jgi:hypothetical protein
MEQISEDLIFKVDKTECFGKEYLISVDTQENKIASQGSNILNNLNDNDR